jgi:hypothetical protein
MKTMTTHEYEAGERVMYVGSYPLVDGVSFVTEYGRTGVVENIDYAFDPPHVTVRWDDTKCAFDMLVDEIIPTKLTKPIAENCAEKKRHEDRSNAREKAIARKHS